MAIIVDGTDTVVRNGTVGFPVGSVRQPGRPLAGLGIAIVTALVTMGAMGPRPPSVGTALSDACVPASSAPIADWVPLQPVPSVASSPVPWWLLPQMAEWVDPATGQSMQEQADRQARAVHGPHLAP